MSSYSLLHLISQNGTDSHNGMAFGQRLPVEPLGELLAFIPFRMAGKMGIPAHSFGSPASKHVRLYELRLQIEESQQRIKALEQQIQKLQQERSEQKQKMEGLRKEEQELHKEFMQPAEGDYDVQVSQPQLYRMKARTKTFDWTCSADGHRFLLSTDVTITYEDGYMRFRMVTFKQLSNSVFACFRILQTRLTVENRCIVNMNVWKKDTPVKQRIIFTSRPVELTGDDQSGSKTWTNRIARDLATTELPPLRTTLKLSIKMKYRYKRISLESGEEELEWELEPVE